MASSIDAFSEKAEIPSILAKSILIRNKDSRWFGANYNMNLYRGCVHGCIYCDSRSLCYRIDNFDQVCYKQNALPILEAELAQKTKQGVIATGAMSDPYNPFEKTLELTQKSLKLIDKYQFGFAIATKSDLITRDIPLLADIRRHSPVLCKLTITCMEDTLSAKIEPRVAASSNRFAAVEALAARGIFSGVLLMPVLPHITDNIGNITGIVRRAAACGARFVYPNFGVTMRAGQREYFLRGLDSAFPGMGHSGRYMGEYGDRYYCGSPRSRELWTAFQQVCHECGLLYEMTDIIVAYQEESGTSQMSFM